MIENSLYFLSISAKARYYEEEVCKQSNFPAEVW